ncbi:MAG TPA: proline racemase family protein [Longimicrobiales bacterium]
MEVSTAHEVAGEFPSTMVVVDSHTEGEPTRVVVEGWPQPEGRTMAERRDSLRRRDDHLRRGVVLEPRGHAALVGALLTPPVERGSAAGVVFFNNVGYLGMCGHGTIGVVATLRFLDRLAPGPLRIDTPVGTVGATLEADGAVTIENVPAYCHALDVAVQVPGLGRITGDVAWGGNWFFITEVPGVAVTLSHLDELQRVTRAIVHALAEQGITGAAGAGIDHVELSARPRRADADSCNFVLCPGGEYDRSPCGTGTSARMAVLHARGELALGERWAQEGISGSLFQGWLSASEAGLVPHIRGRAFVTGQTVLRFDPADPFRAGLTP